MQWRFIYNPGAKRKANFYLSNFKKEPHEKAWFRKHLSNCDFLKFRQKYLNDTVSLNICIKYNIFSFISQTKKITK